MAQQMLRPAKIFGGAVECEVGVRAAHALAVEECFRGDLDGTRMIVRGTFDDAWRWAGARRDFTWLTGVSMAPLPPREDPRPLR